MPEIDITGYKRITLEELNDQGVYNLVEGIVDRAARDWREYAHKNTPECQWQRMRIERFFRSQYFHGLTGLNGEAVLNQLKRMEGIK